MPPTIKGEWVSDDKTIFVDRMIPVRIACTPIQMREIALMTGEYYEQLCIMYYMISNSVTLINIGEREGLTSPAP